MITNCRLNPDFYRKAIVAANVATIEEAKVVYLTGAHPFRDGYAQHAEFNKKVVQAIYTPGSRLHVEDNYLKSKEALDKRQIANLNPDDYCIEGWNDPESCAVFETIVKVLNAVNSLRKVWNRHSEAFATVQSFALRYPHPTFTDKEHLLLFCEYHASIWKEEYNLETFLKRQQCLRDRPVSCLQNTSGQVIVFEGENHVDPKNEPFKSWAADFIKSLGTVPYMILNPARL